MRRLKKNEKRIMAALWRFPQGRYCSADDLRKDVGWKGDIHSFQNTLNNLIHDAFVKRVFYDGTLATGLKYVISKEEYKGWLDEVDKNGCFNV